MSKRVFETGATRDSADEKLDYEGFVSPIVLRRFAEYMQQHRVMVDGSLRDSDNWQKGIPPEVYVKSLVRHVVDLWCAWRTTKGRLSRREFDDLLCAIMFNAMGLLYERLPPGFRPDDDPLS